MFQQHGSKEGYLEILGHTSILTFSMDPKSEELGGAHPEVSVMEAMDHSLVSTSSSSSDGSSDIKPQIREQFERKYLSL